MLERYRVCERYADNGELSHRALVDSDNGEEVGSDGGEPEDATFWRDWKWVPELLNKQQATIADLQGQLKEQIHEREHYYQRWMQRTEECESMQQERDALQQRVAQLDEYRQAYEEAMKASNAAGYVGFTAAQTINDLQADHTRVLQAIETIRDAVLNGRGPLAEMDVDNDVINAVLAIIDDNSLPAQPAQGGAK